MENNNELYLSADTHKTTALNQLNSLLTFYMENHDYKKVHLLSYWFESFAKYNLAEQNFNPQNLKRYKRGSIIKADLGFNIGNEEGGLHYCIVLDKNNFQKSGTLTVIPLTSIKTGKKYSKNTVNLGNEIYTNLSNIHKEMSLKLTEEYNNIWKLPPEKLKNFTKDFEYLNKIKDEINKMKKGSIALTQQITTISKLRIYDPKTTKDVLSNLRVSNETLDIIDKKIKELYLKNE